MSGNVFQELKIRAQLDPVMRRKLAAYPLQFLANFDLSFDEKQQIVLPRFKWRKRPDRVESSSTIGR